jgi:hypothetical protein
MHTAMCESDFHKNVKNLNDLEKTDFIKANGKSIVNVSLPFSFSGDNSSDTAMWIFHKGYTSSNDVFNGRGRRDSKENVGNMSMRKNTVKKYLFIPDVVFKLLVLLPQGGHKVWKHR